MSSFKSCQYPLIDRFMEYCLAERALSAATLLAYRHDLERFYGGLGSRGQLAWPAVAPRDCQDYLRSLTREGLSTATVRRVATTLRQFFRFVMQEGLITEDPARHLETAQMARVLPHMVPDNAVEKLLAVLAEDTSAKSLRARALIELLYAAGLRVSELTNLPLAAVNALPARGDLGAHDAENASVTLAEVRIIGKGSRERVVPIHAMAWRAVQDYLKVRQDFMGRHKTSPWLFPSRHGDPLSRQSCAKILKDLALRAGLNPQEIFPHAFRHRFATDMLANGADLLSVQQLLGHQSVATTQIYTHVDTQRLHEVMTKHHPLKS